jgi:uncharacterized protein (TIGR00369 family)
MTTDPQPHAKTVAESRFTLSALLQPQDTNNMGNVHGGVIMKLVDEAGAIAAMRHANRQVVTVAIDSMTFNEPIRLGNLVQCKAELTYVGRTSIEVYIEVYAESIIQNTSRLTNQAYVVYVALDAGGTPTPVPPLRFESEAEERRAAQAAERQAYRKQQKALHQPTKNLT